MPKSIPDGLTSHHVLLALKDLDEGFEHPFGSATGYQLLHEGIEYSPKAVVGIAFRHLSGEILAPSEFSGGEKTGQANDVLRELGFAVEPIVRSQKSFVTSRGYSIPTDWTNFQQAFWFNMWQRRVWPFKEVSQGDLLYWYDSKSQKIVWKSEVTKLERYEYTTKEELREKLLGEFGEDPATDPYYADKSEAGYCIAFKVNPIEQLDLQKPDNFRFSQGGWQRGSEPKIKQWLFGVENKLTSLAVDLVNEGYHDPTTAKDERERKLREVVQRRGQPKFRNDLIEAYSGKCAVTGCDVIQALEAAHIAPYLGTQSNHVSNGLLLRADIHTLFDLGYIAIEPTTLKVKLVDSLKVSSFGSLHDQQILLPVEEELHPSLASLKARWQTFNEDVEAS